MRSSRRGDASACCQSVPLPTTSACPGRPVERLVSRGQLPVVKVGASTRYDVEDLDGFVARRTGAPRAQTVGLTS